MRKLILLSIAILLCAIFRSNAQSGFSCTLEDANGEVVVVELIIGNEIPFSLAPNVCLYPVQLTITALDGMADQDVLIQVKAGGAYNQAHVLLAGQQSASVFPVNILLPLICGTTANIQFSVIGNPSSSCLDQALFPVELTHFEASNMDDGRLKLVWETASEIDNEGFNIERSQDGYKWEVLDFVKGAGTTLKPQSYQWMDDKPYRELNYYRLQQIDFDGDMEYSEIVVAKMTNKNKITVFPNPASDFITLDLGEESTIQEVELHNIQGRLVRSIPVEYGINRQNIILEDLTAGLYWIVVSSKHSREQIKFIKQ